MMRLRTASIGSHRSRRAADREAQQAERRLLGLAAASGAAALALGGAIMLLSGL